MIKFKEFSNQTPCWFIVDKKDEYLRWRVAFTSKEAAEEFRDGDRSLKVVQGHIDDK